jgi:hypothetical protein
MRGLVVRTMKTALGIPWKLSGLGGAAVMLQGRGQEGTEGRSLIAPRLGSPQSRILSEEIPFNDSRLTWDRMPIQDRMKYNGVMIQSSDWNKYPFSFAIIL